MRRNQNLYRSLAITLPESGSALTPDAPKVLSYAFDDATVLMNADGSALYKERNSPFNDKSDAFVKTILASINSSLSPDDFPLEDTPFAKNEAFTTRLIDGAKRFDALDDPDTKPLACVIGRSAILIAEGLFVPREIIESPHIMQLVEADAQRAQERLLRRLG